jgi:hypothetical protein
VERVKVWALDARAACSSGRAPSIDQRQLRRAGSRQRRAASSAAPAFARTQIRPIRSGREPGELIAFELDNGAVL